LLSHGNYVITKNGVFKAMEEYAELRLKQAQQAVWVKGDYDRLYDQVKADKRTICFVNYFSGYDNEKLGPMRDICTCASDGMEFFARGIGYGNPRHFMYKGMDEKQSFIALCEHINVEWLDESNTYNYSVLKEKLTKEIEELNIFLDEAHLNFYALKEKAAKMETALKSLVLSVKAHPHYTGEDNAEWTDLINIAERALEWEKEEGNG
jgi:hypothetical protein